MVNQPKSVILEANAFLHRHRETESLKTIATLG